MIKASSRGRFASTCTLFLLCLAISIYILFTITLFHFCKSLLVGRRVIPNLRTSSKHSFHGQAHDHDLCFFETIQKESDYVIYHNGSTGRLGNLMFSFASIQGIAEATKRKSVFHDRFKILKTIFPNLKSTLKTLSDASLEEDEFVSMLEYGPWSWEERRLVRNLPNKPVSICCYLNSWKYFARTEEKIRKKFQFSNNILKKADNFLSAVHETVTRVSNTRNITFVGVHIRMGDIFLDKQMRDAGFRVAPLNYILTAMAHYRQKYKDVHFIVCTDNIEWTRKNIGTMSRDVHLASQGINDVDDMALLTRCNHSIMTQGTFGWWASFLAGGDVVYYHPPVAPTMGIFNKTYRRENVYPPSWICYTDDPYGEKLDYVRPCRSTDQI